MDLRQLKYFVQITESGNFSRAAEMLRIAQPSLSQQVKNLEEELGVDLLLRHARGVTPTDMGQQLYDHARRILEEVAGQGCGALAIGHSVRPGCDRAADLGLPWPLHSVDHRHG